MRWSEVLMFNLKIWRNKWKSKGDQCKIDAGPCTVTCRLEMTGLSWWYWPFIGNGRPLWRRAEAAGTAVHNKQQLITIEDSRRSGDDGARRGRRLRGGERKPSGGQWRGHERQSSLCQLVNWHTETTARFVSLITSFEVLTPEKYCLVGKLFSIHETKMTTKRTIFRYLYLVSPQMTKISGRWVLYQMNTLCVSFLKYSRKFSPHNSQQLVREPS